MTFEEILTFDHPSNGKVFEEICSHPLNQLIPFVGAGLSADVFPTWENFLKQGYKSLGIEHSPSGLDYLRSASDLLDKMGKADFYANIRRAFGDHNINNKRREVSAITLLPELFNGLVITTNFDRLLEHTYPPAWPVAHPGHREALNAALNLTRPLLYKIHGCITEAESLVFTQESYGQHYSSGTDLVKDLTKCFTDRRLLFLGSSLLYDKTIELWTQLANDEPGLYHFAIMSCKAGQQQELRKKLGDKKIRTILYEDGKYDSVRIILEQLLLNHNREKYLEVCKNRSFTSTSSDNPFMFDANSVDFIGRDEELDELINFCTDKKEFAWAGITGPGGTGKTRLAYELEKQMRNKGWKTYLVRTISAETLEEVYREIDGNTLVMIDYVKWISTNIGEWALRIQQKWRNSGVKIRLILLEREEFDVKTTDWKPEILNNRIADKDGVAKNGLLRLRVLEKENIPKIIESYAGKSINAAPIMEALKHVDPELSRPLYILFLTDAVLHGNSLSDWDKEHALQYVCDKELYRWRTDITRWCEGHNEDNIFDILERILLVATLSGGIKTEQLETVLPKEYEQLCSFLRHERALPFLEDIKFVKTGKNKKEKKVSYYAPFEPDMIGEFFCVSRLMHMQEDLAAQVLDAAYSNHLKNTAVTLNRICKDFSVYLREHNIYDLFSIIKPQNIKALEKRAFEDCDTIEHIVLPPEIIRIDAFTFQNCSSVKSVLIPDGVKTIGAYAFAGCQHLESLSIPDSVTEIKYLAFGHETNIKELVLPEGLTDVCGFKFNQIGAEEIDFLLNYTRWEHVTIPDSVTELEALAFSHCCKLKTVHIPNSVTRIGWKAFSGCTSLLETHIPDSVTHIGALAFQDTPKLKKLSLPKNISTVCGFRFARIGERELEFLLCYTQAQHIEIPDTVTEVFEDAFRDCEMETVEIPETTKKIGKRAFFLCYNLTHINLPDNLTVLRENMFLHCRKLTTVIIPPKVRRIKNGVFMGCESLRELTIPSTVKKIGITAFSGCTRLDKLTLPKHIKAMGTLDDLLDGFGGRLEFNYISKDELEFLCAKKEGNLTTPPGLKVLGGRALGFSDVEKLHVTKNVLKIGIHAFLYCRVLEEIHFEEGVKKIGMYAFDDCSALEHVTLPKSLKILSLNTFSSCASLETITLHSHVNPFPLFGSVIYLINQLRKRSGGGFRYVKDCPKLHTVYVKGRKRKALCSMFPPSVKVIFDESK